MLTALSWSTSLALVFQGLSMAPSATALPSSSAGESKYGPITRDGVNSLNKNWYSNSTGLWGELWWNSGNAFNTIADFAIASPSYSASTDPRGILENTFIKAQEDIIQTNKTFNIQIANMVESHYCINGLGNCAANVSATNATGSLARRGFLDFLNEFYDDEGWWALGLIRAYDFTRDKKYLDAAVKIYEDMGTGAGTNCDGGIYWSKERKYVNAIANELYLAVAASLANRVSDGDKYLKVAQDQWDWFWYSGMINSENLINDGLDDKCNNNGQPTWSYNQGVILGGLVELWHATGDDEMLSDASDIAKAAIKRLSNVDGVLVEVGGCEFQPGRCGNDGQQFKGIFLRNLGYLHQVYPKPEFRSFILTNADAIWNKDRENGTDKLGPAWDGPYLDATSASQSSALDALVAALTVA